MAHRTRYKLASQVDRGDRSPTHGAQRIFHRELHEIAHVEEKSLLAGLSVIERHIAMKAAAPIPCEID
jgi:hypothetical protein